MYTQLALPLPEVEVATRACQRWRDRASYRYADPAERFDARRYEVREIDDAAATRYVVDNHYLASYPAASRRLGLFRRDELVGVAVFSVPPQAAVLTNVFPGLEPYRASVELGRFVLGDAEPGNSESWFLARCFGDFLYPAGVRGVVSFADPVPRLTSTGEKVHTGHLGWIYQGSNGVYTGRGTARTLDLLPDGRTLNPRTKQKIRAQERGHEGAERQLIALGARAPRAGERPSTWLDHALEDIGVRKLRHRGCHRYVFPLGEEPPGARPRGDLDSGAALPQARRLRCRHLLSQSGGQGVDAGLPGWRSNPSRAHCGNTVHVGAGAALGATAKGLQPARQGHRRVDNSAGITGLLFPT